MTFKVDEPGEEFVIETGFGVKLALDGVGSPLTLKLTLPVNPPDGDAVTVKFVVLPRGTVCDEGAAVRVKLPVTGALTTRVTYVELLNVLPPLDPVPVMVRL